jgi:hypothetical protein
MYDYKFRHHQTRGGSRKRPLLKVAAGGAALTLAGAALFAVVTLTGEPDGKPKQEEAGFDVIPLSIPPRPGVPKEPLDPAPPGSGALDLTVSQTQGGILPRLLARG